MKWLWQNKEMVEDMADESGEYLVRGALLYCDQGTHPRRLNLPQCHGAYVYGNPIIIETDCTKNNVKFFGVCCSATPPEGAEVQRFEGYVPEGSTETAEPVEGPRCTPDIVGLWQDCHGGTATTNSCLICNCGGIIRTVSS